MRQYKSQLPCIASSIVKGPFLGTNSPASAKNWRLRHLDARIVVVGGQDRFAVHVLLHHLELVHEKERFGAFLRQGIETPLESGDLVGVGRGKVVLLRGVLRKVIELDAGRKRRVPNELPITPVSYTHLRAHETPEHLVCRLLLE